MVKSRAECDKCGRTVYVGEGHWTNWGGKWNQPKFFCFPCLRKMEKAEYDARNAVILAERRSWLGEALKQPTLKECEDNAMAEVLRELCHVAGWYALRDIQEKFNARQGTHDPRSVSHVLCRIGFTQRARKKRGSYMHVFVDPCKIPDLNKPVN